MDGFDYIKEHLKIRTPTTYKYYFILSLLDFFYENKYEIHFDEIATRMLIKSRNDVDIYLNSFNSMDMLPKIKKDYILALNISSNLEGNDLKQKIEQNLGILKKYRLLSYIPYVFIQERDWNLNLNNITYREKLRKIEEYSKAGTSLYQINQNKTIVLNKGFLNSLEINKDEILDYIHKELYKHLRGK